MPAETAPGGGTSVESLLSNALPAPRYVKPASSAAVVSLAVHCLMVEAGFQHVESPAGPPSYVPPGDWNGKFHNEWVFNYVKDSCTNRFVLHLSLQAVSGRMFVQCLEDNNLTNIHNLGLVPANYVPDASKLDADSWTGIVQKEEQLRDYVTSYLSARLAQDAVPAFQPPASASGTAAAAQLPAASAADPAAQPSAATGGNSPAGGDSSAVGRIAAEGLTGLVGADSAMFSGLTRPVALVSAVVAAAAVACIVWSRSGRV